MLKLTVCTMTHNIHAETDDFDQDTLRGVPKCSILAVTYFSHAENDNFYHETFRYAEMADFDHDIFQTC
jgi:hypothetical protein